MQSIWVNGNSSEEGPRVPEVNTMLKRLFVDHPSSVGETYFEHQRRALGFAGAMFLGSVACFVHSLVPAAFTSTASRTISRLYERMIVSRR
jgi:hypothetical protein